MHISTLFIMAQGSPFPTARRPGASKTTSRASEFEQIFPLYFIQADRRISEFLKSGKWWFWEKAMLTSLWLLDILVHINHVLCIMHISTLFIKALQPLNIVRARSGGWQPMGFFVTGGFVFSQRWYLMQFMAVGLERTPDLTQGGSHVRRTCPG